MNEKDRQAAGLLNAAKWGVWTWVAIAGSFMFMIFFCCVCAPLIGAIGG